MHLERNSKGLFILTNAEILAWLSPGKTQYDMNHQTKPADKNPRRRRCNNLLTRPSSAFHAKLRLAKSGPSLSHCKLPSQV